MTWAGIVLFFRGSFQGHPDCWSDDQWDAWVRRRSRRQSRREFWRAIWL